MKTGNLFYPNLMSPGEYTPKQKVGFRLEFYVINVLHFELKYLPTEKDLSPRRSDYHLWTQTRLKTYIPSRTLVKRG